MRDTDEPTRSVSRRGVLGGCAAVVTAGLTGCSGSLDAESTITREYDAADLSTVVVDATNGEIEIRGGERDTVAVEATKQAADEDALDDVTLDADRNGEALALTVDASGGGLLSLDSTPRMDLVVSVPNSLTVTAETTNGDVTLTLEGPESVRADTTNGDIEVALTGPADVTADTTNGDVSITVPADAEPVISFETTNGRFEATGLDAGSIEADGDIERTIGDGTHRLSVDTTNGDFSIQGTA